MGAVLKVARDRFQLFTIRRGLVGIKAMVDMVMDQGAFCIGHGIFDRLHLLCDLDARFACLDHLDHCTQVPIGAFEPSNQSRMCCMGMGLYHKTELSPPRG